MARQNVVLDNHIEFVQSLSRSLGAVTCGQRDVQTYGTVGF